MIFFPPMRPALPVVAPPLRSQPEGCNLPSAPHDVFFPRGNPSSWSGGKPNPAAPATSETRAVAKEPASAEGNFDRIEGYMDSVQSYCQAFATAGTLDAKAAVAIRGVDGQPVSTTLREAREEVKETKEVLGPGFASDRLDAINLASPADIDHALGYLRQLPVEDVRAQLLLDTLTHQLKSLDEQMASGKDYLLQARG